MKNLKVKLKEIFKYNIKRGVYNMYNNFKKDIINYCKGKARIVANKLYLFL